ncbi:DEKNAAC101515 [Brettanomyces naardenensis]|uniref:DEKNAAC101515 n=1 Tax=Brettanomyces naardenensis TaxID=13370 RepID=A0A448YHY1_BRENA|nr:DEKNAAC101515 [Brettanomyces naardenensis]
MDPTYTANLKSQIQQKKRLLEVAQRQLSSLEQSQSIPDDPKYEIVALLETLKRIPYEPSDDDLIHLSLAETNLVEQIEDVDRVLGRLKVENEQDLQKQLDTESQLLELYNELDRILEVNISEKEMERQMLVNNDDTSTRYDDLQTEVNKLRERSKQLAEFTKTLVGDYMLKNEFSIFDYEDQVADKKNQFLKLLEILLNNAITSSGGSEKTLEVANKDDPLIRYLIVNNIVVVDRKNPNRIRLRI